MNNSAQSAQLAMEISQAKWGSLVSGGGKRGFTIVPDALLRNQGALDITPSEMTVLLNLIAHWWFADRPPFPGNDVLIERTGLGKRAVQRAIAGLKKKGLIEIELTRKSLSKGGYLSQRLINFDALKRRLMKLEGITKQ